MKKHLNRLLALFLCLSFVCSFLPVMAETSEDLLRFQVENGEATLVGTDFSISGDVVIPAHYQGYPVTAIAAHAFSDEVCVQSVTIPYTVTSIHREAFMCFDLNAFYVDANSPAYWADPQGVLYSKDQTTLVRAPLQISGSYTVPAGVTAIEEYAFHLCFGLTEAILPEGLTHIGQRAFDACNQLSALCLPESVSHIGVYAFSGCSKLLYTTYDNAKYLGTADNPYHALVAAVSESTPSAKAHPDTRLIASAAFRQCYSMTEVTIPEGVQSIGDWAFNGCTALTQLQLPSTLLFIGNDAFAGLNLTGITIPESVQYIGSGAFRETALTEVRLGKNVAQIGEAAFLDCQALTGIWVNEENPHYSSDSHGFLFNKAQTVLLNAPQLFTGVYEVPNSVTKIESYAFYRCRELTGIVLPESLAFIGDYAFYNCWHLSAIDIPESVTFLGNYAFSVCDALDTVTIPSGITELPAGLFYNSDILSVSLPDGLTGIGADAFRSCGYLKDINIPAGVTTIAENAFRDCRSLQTVTVPEGVTKIGASAFQGCSGLIRISLPNSIRTVGAGAFYNCPELICNYTLPINGKYLGNEENPYLVLISDTNDEVMQMTLDPNTKVIADGALASCCELRSITLPEGLLTIGSKSFYCCESLRELTIPSTVTYIGENAFERDRLSQIIIPASVQEIGNRAFSQCQQLTAVRFAGRLPVIGPDAFEGVTATAYCHVDQNADRMKQYSGDLTWMEGHVFLNYQPDRGFSCTSGGTKTATCEGCGVTDTVTATETAEHLYQQGICTVCGTVDPNCCFLSGTLTSSGDSDTIMTLLQNGEPVFTLTASGNTYLWEQLQPGDYTLTLAKENHVTYTAPITVKAGKNDLDLTLCRPGDVVGIGDLNMGDISRIYSHIRGTSPLTGYTLTCADVNGNGTVNMGDIAKLYAHIRGN